MGAKRTATSGFLLAILLCVSVWSHSAYSQVQGNKAVIGSSGAPVASTVWIDASAWWDQAVTTNPDLCGIINTIITGLISSGSNTGVVIDARGLYNSTFSNEAVNCPSPETPFPSSAIPSFAMTILLPAASIPMYKTWTLPNNTRLVGEGQNTNLVAQSGFSGTYMIEMGGSLVCPSVSSIVVCTSVGIEHLLLSDSNGTGVGGIENQFSTNSSYVNDVNLRLFSATGLRIAAADSGPYSGIAFGSSQAIGAVPICIDVEAQTLGVHGVTCTGSPTIGVAESPNSAAIYVNASNNSIEDVHIEGFFDGIQIGNTTTATIGNIVVANVTGSKSGTNLCGSGNTSCLVKNVVHICGSHPHDATHRGTCANSGTVQDVTVSGVTGLSFSSGDVMATIDDDASSTSIVRCASCEMPLTTAVYTLGEPYGGGYARLATNPVNPTNYDSTSTFVPTWSAGSLSSTVTGDSCLTPGALYSNITGGSTVPTLYVCTYNGATYWWQPIA